MQRYLPKTLNQWLLMLAVVVTVGGWLTGFWLLGAGIAFTALCAVGARTARPQRSATPEPADTDTVVLSEPFSKKSDLTLVEEMLAQGRVALLLRPQVADSLTNADLKAAEEQLDESMAMVPEGPVAMRFRGSESKDATANPPLVGVEGLFLDRYAVTNREFQAFVNGGGYDQMSLWDEAIWPAVLSFVDQTGQPGPRFWENGEYPRGKGDHPVVGVSWYEAWAYARWVGKRLPTDPEWVKTASWPVFADDVQPTQRRFPWGDAMDRERVNLWGSGYDGTIPVRSLPAGSSVNGVEQLVGNVWEWTSSTFGAWDPPKQRIETETPLKSIRGGAFDTYFESQANSHFQSGARPLDRKHNIGFRCALGFCDVVNMSPSTSNAVDDPFATDDTDHDRSDSQTQTELVLS